MHFVRRSHVFDRSLTLRLRSQPVCRDRIPARPAKGLRLQSVYLAVRCDAGLLRVERFVFRLAGTLLAMSRCLAGDHGRWLVGRCRALGRRGADYMERDALKRNCRCNCERRESIAHAGQLLCGRAGAHRSSRLRIEGQADRLAGPERLALVTT
jgi:hypothetical protein